MGSRATTGFDSRSRSKLMMRTQPHTSKKRRSSNFGGSFGLSSVINTHGRLVRRGRSVSLLLSPLLASFVTQHTTHSPVFFLCPLDNSASHPSCSSLNRWWCSGLLGDHMPCFVVFCCVGVVGTRTWVEGSAHLVCVGGKAQQINGHTYTNNNSTQPPTPPPPILHTQSYAPGCSAAARRRGASAASPCAPSCCAARPPPPPPPRPSRRGARRRSWAPRRLCVWRGLLMGGLGWVSR